ncbi:substrate-binding periplasmic protein [Thalassomonas haliotis]|uniref:Transporter substrate-binding domain-containing protein n=1 Tax=Thalassomonas haliotis TaxID=485448 RepID=A0ABY7V7S1_9GAMM|nr:transporter substrate-binding domain-containing protein [Thalassomonas haliotis]WDE09707.1 transporter substrate-binding domain-containing protein [Thalassomonas haliotis]
MQATAKSVLPYAKQTPKGLVTLSASVPPFPPFVLKNPSILCQGVTKRLLNLIGHQANINFHYQDYPYARILHSLTTGQLDVALIFKNQSIKDSVQYIGPVARSQVIVVTKKNHRLKQYRDLQKLNGIAVIRKAQFEPIFDRDSRLHKINVENYVQALHMFIAGRVDAVVGSREGLEYAMIQLDYDTGLLEDAFHLGHKSWWLHVSDKSPGQLLNPALQDAVNRFPHSDRLYDLFNAEKSNGCYDRQKSKAG